MLSSNGVVPLMVGASTVVGEEGLEGLAGSEDSEELEELEPF